MASEIKKFYEFGDFRFDAQTLQLEHGGEFVRLPPKSLKALSVLLERRGETVSRANLMEEVWAESFVEDANLTVAVSVLRKTLSAGGGEKFIETVPCRGYRFVGDAQEKIEINEQPIVIERRAVEQLTIEKTSRQTKKFPRFVYLPIALLGLLAAVGAFAVWQRGAAKSVNSSNNEAANEAFLKGNALLEKREVCESIPYFRQTIANDARFARAYAGLAAALAMCGDPTDEADEAIAKALALDASLAEAHATDGFIKMFRHWDWTGAENSLRLSVALDPNSAKAHHWLAVCLSIRGRFQEAVGEMRRAIEIDPDSPLYYADLCQIHYFESDSERALTACQKALELDPNFVFTPKYLRDVYLLRHDEQKAWEYEAKNLLSAFTTPESMSATEAVFKRKGFKGLYETRIEGALKQIKDGKIVPKNRTFFPLSLAENYALLGDRENTLYWLEQSFSDEKTTCPFSMAYLGVNPDFAFLRDDARFQAVLKKVNLSY